MGTFNGMTVIDDSNYESFVTPPEGMSTGYQQRDWQRVPFGSIPGVRARNRRIYPRSEWRDRLKQRADEGALLSDVWKYHKLPILNQQQTNYCWVNAVIGALHGKRALQGLPLIPLSPASVGSLITGFQNIGGFGGDAIKFISEHGAAPAELWPANAIQRQYDNAESREARKLFTIAEWDEIRPRSFDELASALLDGEPCCVGHNWWGHEILHIDLVYFGAGDWGSLFVNSWGEDWENGGMAYLHESKATPDDAQCLRVVGASTWKRAAGFVLNV